MTQDEYLTATEVAQRLKLNVETMRRLVLLLALPIVVVAASVPAESAVVNAVQSGSTTLGNGSSSVTATLSPAVDTSKSFLVFGIRLNVADPDNVLISGQITNATTLTFQRIGTSGDVFVNWYVVEFASGVTVQRGNSTLTGTTANVAVSSVDLAKSFPLITVRQNGTTIGADDFLRASLTSPTNLLLTRLDSAGTANVEWQVVQYDDASVQSGTVSFSSASATQSATGLSAFDTSKAWLLYTYEAETGTGSNIGQKLVNGRISGSTSLEFRRDQTGQTIDLHWYLVEFQDGTTVQHSTEAFTTAQTQRDVTISSVDPALSIGVGGWQQRGGRSTYTANDNPGVGWFTAELTSGTNLRLRRDFTGTSTADLGWFVIEFPSTWIISGNVYDDIDDDGVFDAGELGIGTGWVKLFLGATFVEAVQPDPETGAYSFSPVLDGNYTVIADDNGLGTDSTPTAPANWAFRTPAGGSRAVAVSGADVSGRDFGLTFDFDLATDCSCGVDDGVPLQRTITVDGDGILDADWAAVLTDLDNNACDEANSDDRDYPIQSTGRNLVRLAYTYDGSNFSMLTQRVGQSNNTQNFVYYADIDLDGIMQNGEPVIVAKWQGNTGNVVVERYTYDDLGSGGDPLLDSNGFSDGYSMPGDLNLVETLPALSGHGQTLGNGAGIWMEWTVDWSKLGVAPGAAIGWHVGSTNSNPASSGLGAQIDDNMGGCGGQCAGSNQFGGVSGDPVSIGYGQTIYLAHKVTNTGNGNDLFDLSWSSSGDFAPVSVTFYHDLGTVGSYDPGVDLVLADTEAPADGVPDTGVLSAGASIDLLVGVTTPGPPTLGTMVFETIVTSNLEPGCGGSVTPPSAAIENDVNLDGVDLQVVKDDGVIDVLPGGTLTYTITVTNAGPDDSVGAQVADTFSATWFDLAALSWTCAITTAGSGADTCADAGPTIGNISTTVDLSQGAVATFNVTAPVKATAYGTISNTATATAINETDTTPANDSNSDLDTVIRPRQIVKRAFQLDGTPIASGSTLPTGMPVRFMLYIDNPGAAVADVSLQEVFNALFQYQAGSIKVDNTLASSTVCPGGVCDEAAIFTQVDGSGTAVGDGDAVVVPTDSDVASYTPATTTIDLGDGNNSNNATLNIAADSVWAVVFTIRMQ